MPWCITILLNPGDLSYVFFLICAGFCTSLATFCEHPVLDIYIEGAGHDYTSFHFASTYNESCLDLLQLCRFLQN